MVVPPVEVLITAGNHVPVMPFVDVAGSGGAALFKQSGPMAANKGAISVATSISMEVVTAH